MQPNIRFQLALNVDDLDRAIAYYGKLFGAEVSKREPGYANFALESPPLKLVLFENSEASERLNHVGFEYMDSEGVEAVIANLDARAVPHRVDRAEHCCYADKTVAWAEDPQGLAWEFYKKDRDRDTLGAPSAKALDEPASSSSGVCCA